ncbi:MAG: hypothetical protein VX278_16975 [Myxococcota bacterium]|nr:hypothetical protein [Myxococcota bacterium]
MNLQAPYLTIGILAFALTACQEQSTNTASKEAPAKSPVAKEKTEAAKTTAKAASTVELSKYDTAAICQIEDSSEAKAAQSQEQSQAIFKERQEAVRACYAKQTAETPANVEWGLKIADGKVKTVTFSDESFGKTDLAACLRETASTWTFFNNCTDDAQLKITKK